MLRVKLFTHTDLDGVSCGILGQLAFDNIDIDYCNYDDINEKIQEFIKEEKYKDYNFIMITDIGINQSTVENINKVGDIVEKIQFIDHHKTSLDLMENSWAIVRLENEGKKDSGTSLMYEYMAEHGYIWRTPVLDYFVEEVRRYDTWEWAEVYNDERPKQLNDLLYLYGRGKFIDSIKEKIKSEDKFRPLYGILSEKDRIVIELEEEKKQRYFEDKQKHLKIIKLDGYTAGVVFAESSVSELGHKLLDWNEKIDLSIMIDISKGKVSLRSRKDGVDVSRIAQKYGGGGHYNAAGCEIEKEKIGKIIKSLLGGTKNARSRGNTGHIS